MVAKSSGLVRAALALGCLVLASCAAPERGPRSGTVVAPSEGGGAPARAPADDLRPNATRDDRYSCRRACDRDYSVCMDAGATRRGGVLGNSGYASATCERQLNMCMVRCNSIQ
ncbi:hypothetical protein JL100_006190 [Skermanella mucosa]|uniref:hypothetical protein n=1 Tax=Skermanella mucosa TaxID=1789672 RepID=UPI00192CCAE3|nr:hypothetical protein [Skermanella mucosa]UEM22335.1 hypothetical protein JL100_006190 [Skermanella mucosa]